MMRVKFILLTFVCILAVSSCKDKNQGKKKQESLVQKDTAAVGKLVVEKVIKNDKCLNDGVFLELPISGGESLMINIIENDIQPLELTCDTDNIKTKLCNIDFISYYALPVKNDLRPIIIADECGDSNNYVLAIYYENEMTDFMLIYNSWTEMSDNPKMEITDFKISKEYEISISKKKYNDNSLIEEEVLNYEIDKKGHISALN